MAKIFEFQNNEDKCDCHACQITDAFVYAATECESIEELNETLRELYESAYTEGLMDSLREDVRVKMRMLEKMEDE